MIAKSLTELVGNTPMLELSRIMHREKLPARVLVKIESFNPAGSVKDRTASPWSSAPRPKACSAPEA